jgi:hypothetical protein
VSATGDGAVERAVRCWLNTFIRGMNLCPFAAAPLAADRVQIRVTDAARPEALLEALAVTLRALDADDGIETSLLVHPAVLQDFAEYNQFLDAVDALLIEAGYEGVYQVASFHPHYQFAGTAPDAAENYTNRSPYPLLHVLRERSVAQAAEVIDDDPAAISTRNIERMEAAGAAALEQLLAQCRQGATTGGANARPE